MRLVIFILLGTAFAVPNIGFCQPDTLWTKAYNGAYEHLQVVRASDGGFAYGTIGYSGRFENSLESVVVKLDSEGEVEWRNYFIAGYDTIRQRPLSGVIWTIAQSVDDGFVTAGGTNIGRVGPDGDSLWVRRYRDEFDWSAGEAECCISHDSNIVYASGRNVVKFTIENGDIIWRSVLEHDVSNIEPVGDDGFIAAGYTGFWDNVYAVRIDSEGEMIWEGEYEADEGEICHGIAPSVAGGWCLAVSSRYGNQNAESYNKLMRIDNDGEIIWQRIYDEFGWDAGTSDVVETSDGGFMAVGAWAGEDYFAFRIDYAGEVQWETHYGSWDGAEPGRAVEGTAYSALLMDDLGYAIGGFSNRGCYIVRTEPDPVDLPFELEALAERYNFGAVPVDSVGLGEVALDNFGRRYVFIDSLELSGDSSAFAVQMELPYRINPADTAYIPVGFSPDSIGAFAAALTFFYGDGQSVEVRLSGRGRSLAVPPGEELPEKFELTSVHPNPFNAQTRVTYILPEAARVNLSVYDLSGRRVATLVDVEGGAGVHAAVWDAAGVASGVYVVRVDAGGFFGVRKVVVMR